MTMPRAEDWRSCGGHFSWRPTAEDAEPVEVFHVEQGDPAAPVLLLIHGWPTSSIDWFDVAGPLSARFRVCALDFPGYGFSDKPQGWGYSLSRDEELIEFYLSEVIGTEAAVIVAHDRGDSVALLHAARCAEGRSATRLEHLVLSNGNIFLPLSNLTEAQRRILDAGSGPQVAAALSASVLAEAMGATTFTPPRKAGDPEVEALTVTFGHHDGVKVLPETIQYLAERSKDEQGWLNTLSSAPFPVTLIWGVYDTVSPPRVASYVWNQYLMLKPGGNRLYFIPDANHYLQADRPDAFVTVLLHALGPDDHRPGPLGPESGAPLLVDTSRERLPAAADLLRAEDPVLLRSTSLVKEVYGMPTDTMDPTTAVTYGPFIQAAEAQYSSDPSQLSPATITKMPAGYTLVRTIQMTDFFGTEQSRVFYGYVAVGGEPTTAVVALRGTESTMEWWDDFHWGLVPFAQIPDAGQVAEGFYDIYKSIGTMAPGQQTTSAPTAFAAEVAQAATSGLAAGLDPAKLPLVVTGHSLGGALATMLVTELSATTELKPQAWTFASPRVGDAIFAARYGKLSTVSWRIYNQVDVVPYFPMDVSNSYQPVTTGYAINSLGKAKWSLSCAHSLNTYMHVLSPTTVPLDQACS